MSNPFQYGGIVGKEAFCNRKEELKDLRRAIENRERLFLYSERRLGKTSLVRQVLQGLPRTKYLSAYVDLWPTEGEQSFATAMAKALSTGLASSTDRMLRAAKDFFGALRPSVTVDDQGTPQLTFASRATRLSSTDLREILASPEKIALRRRKRVVVVFDEFQRILEYGTDLVERTLRSAIQDHRRVSYIFLGSRKHLIQRMFLDQSRPLYRSGTHYPLGPIAAEHWLPFVQSRFRRSGRKVAAALVRQICESTGGHPFYTQHLCHAVWELCDEGRSVQEETIAQATELLLERESYAYTALWESFGLNQRRFLTGLAHEPPRVKPFSSEFVQSYGLKSASNAQRAAESLLERDVIERDNSSFLITDRFFAIWVRVNSATS